MQRRMADLETGLTEESASEGMLALDTVYSNSTDLLVTLQRKPYELRSTPLVNPLLMMHNHICSSLRLLLFIKQRIAPKLPPEVWRVIIDRVLNLGRARGDVFPAVRRFGYLADGSLRVNLVPTVLPSIDGFRSGIMTVMGAVNRGTDPERVAAVAATMLGENTQTRLNTERVRALLEAFALPLPEDALLAPRVALALAVDGGGRVCSKVRVRDGWVIR